MLTEDPLVSGLIYMLKFSCNFIGHVSKNTSHDLATLQCDESTMKYQGNIHSIARSCNQLKLFSLFRISVNTVCKISSAEMYFSGKLSRQKVRKLPQNIPPKTTKFEHKM
jgi:hypothetical protein